MSCFECGQPAKGKYSGPCSVCGLPTCPRHTHYYVDDANRAVTVGARPKCAVHSSGVLGVDNLLVSGDYGDRVVARARFRVLLTESGSRVETGTPA